MPIPAERILARDAPILRPPAQMATRTILGSRAWVNPFSGVFPGSNPNPDDHAGHAHSGVSHRILAEASDLDTMQNPGATYFAEAQYITPHEFAWCQTHPGQCNMYNNVSFRRFNVFGTTKFYLCVSRIDGADAAGDQSVDRSDDSASSSRRREPMDARSLATRSRIHQPVSGIMNTRFITRISIARFNRSVCHWGCGITVSNPGFHAPLNHPGIAHDGTFGEYGIQQYALDCGSNRRALSWNTETFAQNQNANAIRFGHFV